MINIQILYLMIRIQKISQLYWKMETIWWRMTKFKHCQAKLWTELPISDTGTNLSLFGINYGKSFLIQTIVFLLHSLSQCFLRCQKELPFELRGFFGDFSYEFRLLRAFPISQKVFRFLKAFENFESYRNIRSHEKVENKKIEDTKERSNRD